ncbi:MAG: TfoX/Sxy family protein [Candidatus Dormibacteraeota bacterium]|nr:TfoX/Sxy family protein [Candidatus Dormibacteraeota bacterium]
MGATEFEPFASQKPSSLLPAMTAGERYAELVRAYLHQPGVSQEGRGFGSFSLRVSGAIFAMLSAGGQLVVKLPSQRVEELVASGDGDRFDPRGGRPLKEWLALRETSNQEWDGLAREALEFVRANRR